MAQPVLDRESFFKRLKRVFQNWKSSKDGGGAFASVDALVIGLQKDDEAVYSKSQAFHLWIFGYELMETLLVICENGIYAVASKKKAEFLKPLEKVDETLSNGLPSVKIMVREKGDAGSAYFGSLVDAIRQSRKGKTVGMFTKDKMDIDVYKPWNERMEKEGFAKVDVSVYIAYLMAPKDEKELVLMKKSCQASCDIFKKYYYEEVVKAIDQEKKVKHSKISDGFDSAIKDKKFVPSVDKLDELETCYPPIVQSGGKYNFKFNTTSNTDVMHFGIICASFGLRYRGYCSNIARTVMVAPTKYHVEAYNVAYDLEEYIIKKMEPGVKLCDIYEAGVKWLEKKKPDMVDHMTKSFGFATGLEFREGTLVINSKTTAFARKGMTFCIVLGFSELKNPEGKAEEEKTFGIWLGDTVVISDTGAATVLTAAAKKKQQQISMVLEPEGGKESEEEEEKTINLADNQNGNARSRRTAVLTDRLRNEASAEERRKRHQEELAARINERALERLNKGKGEVAEPKLRKSNVAYKRATDMPTDDEVKELKIFVDRKNETLILPLFGEPVPFHISMIKSVAISLEGDYTYLRINFNHPGSAVIGGKELMQFPHPEAQFVKELTFRSSNTKEPGELSAPSSNLTNTFRLVKELQKRYKTREMEEREKEGVVQQDTLVLNPNKNQPRLKDLFIRPPLSQKRISGTLEAHVNGFRYTTLRGEKVDLLYNNIKHAFFQPCEGEMIILLHFHLKNHIIYQKRKIIDIQFYTEVGELTTDLGKHYHMHDRDDLASEQAERELRTKLTSAFKSFTEKVESISRGDVDFDTPFRDLGFPGVPHRATVLLQPTSTCLVNLAETPPFVITLEEIELVHFERVQFHIKNFDMVFIFKDYSRKPVLVTAVPMNLLEHVKSWLDSCDIHFTEGIQSLNWTKIMKTIADDPKAFIEEGGWDFLEPENDANKEAQAAADAEEEEEDDEAYAPSESESAESESEEEASSAVDEDEDDEASEELSSGEESGKDWDELEEEAAKADRQKAMEEEQEMSRMPKRPAQRGGGGGGKKMRR
ncbi:FACT complex subunit SPT16-like [Paramacrobiotus metropolitanus]|uniref:FACT complex subunit SPT16-like n=1 Tax=Paramacrobiotus metropolitanus TaxID=2943436 RepID=UPI002445EB4B|nr:FACT complex subunit SPT16-like [Paramacrobiotus metropolitanus]